MRRAPGSGRRRLARSVVEIAAVSLDEMLDGWDERAGVFPSAGSWRHRCRRALRRLTEAS